MVAVVPADAVHDAEIAAVATTVVAGGETRSESVRSGLAAVPAGAATICVHDGARPLASIALYERVAEAVTSGADGAVPGLAVTDTLKGIDRDVDPPMSTGTFDRDGLVAVQTPQAFAADALREAHAGGGQATDDAGLVEESGGRVVVVEGESTNIKITEPIDLAIAQLLLDRP